MMVFTHVLIGILVGVCVATLHTGSLPQLVFFGAVGGLIPDLDMLLVHRKTLHFPVLYSALTAISVTAYVISGSSLLVAIGVLTFAASLHSWMDALGGGKEMRPWNKTDDRAVYNHITGEWINPLRLFYDGSVPDVLIAVGVGIASIRLSSGSVRILTGTLIVLSLVYALLRRTITKWIPREYTTFSGYIQDRVR